MFVNQYKVSLDILYVYVCAILNLIVFLHDKWTVLQFIEYRDFLGDK